MCFLLMFSIMPQQSNQKTESIMKNIGKRTVKHGLPKYENQSQVSSIFLKLAFSLPNIFLQFESFHSCYCFHITYFLAPTAKTQQNLIVIADFSDTLHHLFLSSIHQWNQRLILLKNEWHNMALYHANLITSTNKIKMKYNSA